MPATGGGDGADGQGGHGQHGVPSDGGVEADLGLVQAEAVLPVRNCSSTGQRSTAARISRVKVSGCPSGTKQ